MNADIDIFVKNVLANDEKLLHLPTETKEEIEQVFRQKAGVMSQWTPLQLQSVGCLKTLCPK
ncbi:hypothetical protein QQX98_000947 [Neonectria punicea]|uniref:Uncharacterized protein n=1 Tax=Neonectria punicea TaxID=979145 RepID=A0ABR1HQH2_9HYPO